MSPIELNAVRTGPRGGPPVVLVHPVGLDLTFWGEQIAALRDSYDVVALDLPGHGRSEGGPQDWTLPRVTEVVGDFLAGLGAPDVHLVGLSVGGMVAQSVTLARPSLVRSLALMDTAASFTDQGRRSMRDRAVAARGQGMSAVLAASVDRWFTSETQQRRPDLIERVTRTLLADDPQVHAAVWEMIAELDLVAQLRDISCPSLVLVGEHDSSSPVSAARQLRDGIAGARLVLVPNTAHLSPLEEPAVVSGHLTAFLAAAY